jgi:hypothetical protein
MMAKRESDKVYSPYSSLLTEKDAVFTRNPQETQKIAARGGEK